MDKSRRNNLAILIFDSAREVHSVVGAGILPDLFKSCLAHEFRLRGLRFRMNAPQQVVYKGIRLEDKLIADFIIEEEIALEIIAESDAYQKQLLKINSILSFSSCSLGILIDPSQERLIDGFKKITNLKKISL
jgi:GxxExxY protein